MLPLLLAGALAGEPYRDKVVYAYLPYWEDGPEAVPWEHITHLSIFSAGMNSDGTLSSTSRWSERAPEAVDLGRSHRVTVELCVTSFDSSTIHSVLGSSSRRATLVETVLEHVTTYGADGVNLDFEGMDDVDYDNLPQLVRELKAAGVGTVTLAMPAVDWAGAYDYATLSELSDGLFIMGYGYHWTGGSAGPNAPLHGSGTWGSYGLEWSVEDYVSYGASPDKIILGLPLYGQVWPVADGGEVPADTTGDGWSITMAEADAEAAYYGKNYDEASTTAWYDAGGEQVWYDDATTLREKMIWATRERDLLGVGFWSLHYDEGDEAFWAGVDEATITDPEEPAGDSGDPGGADGAGAGGDSAEPGGDGAGEGGDGAGEGGDAGTTPEEGVGSRFPADEKGGGCQSAPGLPLGLGLPGLMLALGRRRRR
jgi:hypothetical protein